jgi:hypothetical protein
VKQLATALLLFAHAMAAQAEPVTVSAEPIASFRRLASQDSFGPFNWRGGLTLTSADERFGGFSGLIMGKDCEDLLAVSDRGTWLKAQLVYDGDRLSGITDAQLAAVLNGKGEPPRNKLAGDAEALTQLRDGAVAVGFESKVRIGSYNLPRGGFAARFQAVPHPREIDTGPDNGEIEALGQLADGRLLAIAESQFDSGGNTRAWAWQSSQTTPFSIARYGDYRVTDLAVLDNGSILTLERRFEPTSLPGMAVRRFSASAITHGTIIKPELLLEATAPLYVIDNMEGIAACQRHGTARITLISDDNFNAAVQSTILLQFDYKP